MATQRKTTKSMQRPGTGAHRATGGHARPRAAAKNNTPMIIGGAVGGAVLLIVIIAVVASRGGPDKTPAAAGKTEKVAKPMDVRELIADGETKREQGYTIIQQCESLINKRDLSAAEKADLRGKLEKAVHLIQDGNGQLDKAKQLNPDASYEDSVKYGQSLKLAKMKLLEL